MIRTGADSGERARIVVWTTVIFVIGGGIGAMTGLLGEVTTARVVSHAAIGAFGSAALTYAMMQLFTYAGEAGAVAFTQGTGSRDEPGPAWSAVESMQAAGDTDRAREWYERTLDEWPDHARLLVRAAAFYEGIGEPVRARDLLKKVQRMTDDRATDVQASYRLMDLFDGALNEPDRVLSELRRLADRYPETSIAATALAAIARRKSPPADDPHPS